MIGTCRGIRSTIINACRGVRSDIINACRGVRSTFIRGFLRSIPRGGWFRSMIGGGMRGYSNCLARHVG